MPGCWDIYSFEDKRGKCPFCLITVYGPGNNKDILTCFGVNMQFCCPEECEYFHQA